MNPWAVCAVLAGLLLVFLGVFAAVDWLYMQHVKKVFLRRLVDIAREHQLDHSRYLYPED